MEAAGGREERRARRRKRGNRARNRWPRPLPRSLGILRRLLLPPPSSLSFRTLVPLCTRDCRTPEPAERIRISKNKKKNENTLNNVRVFPRGDKKFYSIAHHPGIIQLAKRILDTMSSAFSPRNLRRQHIAFNGLTCTNFFT